jgi:hypothetical protein
MIECYQKGLLFYLFVWVGLLALRFYEFTSANFFMEL